MKSSQKLQKLVRQLYTKRASGNHFHLAGSLFSHKAKPLLFGSEPKDRYEGYEAILRFYQASGGGKLKIKVDKIRAESEGDFGWVADQVIVTLPDGLRIPVRHSYLFHREGREWKIVHAHISVGIPDEKLVLIQ